MGNSPNFAGEVASFKNGLAVQRRVVGALLVREILTRYGRNNIGFLWLFVEPMLFTLIITALWTATRSLHGSSIPIAAFALTGYSSVLMWRNMPSRCIGAYRANIPLLYHRQVKLFDVYIARAILEFLGASISFVVLGVVFGLVGLIYPPEDFLKVVAAWMLLAWFGAALAVLIGSLSERVEIVQKLWGPASYILFPLSGAAFMVDILPPAMQKAVLYLPMIHGVEMLRDGFFGSEFRAHYDVAYFVCWNLGLTLFALIQMKFVGTDKSEVE